MMEGWKTDKLMNLVSSITTGKLDANAMVPNGQYRFYTCAKEHYFIDEYAFDDEALLISGNGEYVGYIHYYKGKFNAYQRVYVLTGFKVNVKYLQSYLNRYLPIRINKEVSQNNIPYIRLSTLSKMNIRFPESSDEQSAIAAILSKVDEAIASVQASISAAERLKKSLMQNLLTGRMKPDGTLRKEDEFYVDEKFVKVPKGWEVKAIGDKSVCRINPNYKYKKKEVYDFVPMEAVKENFGGLGFIEKQVIDNGSYTRFKAGDILFAKITPCSENGKVAYIEHIDSEVGFASTEFIVFHPTDNVNGQFIYLMLASENVHRLAISLMEGTTGRQRIPWKIFRNRIFVPMPDKEEQNKIVEKILVFDKKISYNYNKIAVLERLKKSLMQNLLTGRVRVKE